MSTLQPGTGAIVVAAAPLDGQARLVLVSWLLAWFGLVTGLMGLWLAGGGALALAAGTAVAAAVPALLLARMAGLPAAFEIFAGGLVVRRYLLGDRTYRLAGPAVREADLAWLRRRAVLLGGGYGCGTVRRPGDGRAVHLATSSLREVLRCDTTAGPLLVSPEDAEAFGDAVSEALR